MFSRLLVLFVQIFLGAYPRWTGSRPTRKQRIYFANHSSHVDTVALWSALPTPLRKRTRPVAARDYWGSGIRNFVARNGFNAVLIERNRDQCQGDPLQPLYDALVVGQSLILFPEGTRNSEAQLLPFKSGLFHLATRFQDVELIPVYLDNARRSMPKGSLLPVPLICTVRFGPAIQLLPDEDKEIFLQRARDAVGALA